MSTTINNTSNGYTLKNPWNGMKEKLETVLMVTAVLLPFAAIPFIAVCIGYANN